MTRRRAAAYCAAAFIVGAGYVVMLDASARLAGSAARALAEWQAGPASSSEAVGEEGS